MFNNTEEKKVNSFPRNNTILEALSSSPKFGSYRTCKILVYHKQRPEIYLY